MKICKIKVFIGSLHIEAIIWFTSLIYLYIINPYATGHFSFCIFKLLGFDFCPGCGLGLSISYLLHFDIINSFHSHYFGIPAFFILIYRIIELIKNDISELHIFQYFKTKEPVND